jgi:pyruvate,water dikinase
VTIGWPLLRRALRRLASTVEAACSRSPDDVYFLQRAELDQSLAGRSPHVDVTARIRTRARQRRLSPPLVIGKVSRFMESTQRGSIAAMRSPASPGEHIVGMPASPGRVTGPVRVVRGPAEFDRLLRARCSSRQRPRPHGRRCSRARRPW